MRRRELLVVVATAAACLPVRGYSERPKRERPLLIWYTSGLPTLPNRFLSALLGGATDAELRQFAGSALAAQAVLVSPAGGRGTSENHVDRGLIPSN